MTSQRSARVAEASLGSQARVARQALRCRPDGHYEAPSQHLQEGELAENAVCANFFAHTAVDGKIYQTTYYNLNAIIAGRELEKLVSVSAGVASATFTKESGRSAHFDSRLWLGIS
jgi:hypothetical protein